MTKNVECNKCIDNDDNWNVNKCQCLEQMEKIEKEPEKYFSKFSVERFMPKPSKIHSNIVKSFKEVYGLNLDQVAIILDISKKTLIKRLNDHKWTKLETYFIQKEITTWI